MAAVGTTLNLNPNLEPPSHAASAFHQWPLSASSYKGSPDRFIREMLHYQLRAGGFVAYHPPHLVSQPLNQNMENPSPEPADVVVGFGGLAGSSSNDYLNNGQGSGNEFDPWRPNSQQGQDDLMDQGTYSTRAILLFVILSPRQLWMGCVAFLCGPLITILSLSLPTTYFGVHIAFRLLATSCPSHVNTCSSPF